MRRAQALAAAVIAFVALGGAAYADRALGPDEPGEGTEPSVASGEWFCPHGGGKSGWEVFLQIANPGERPARIRVRTLGADRAAPPESRTVEPGSFLRVPAPAGGRESASLVEWFDQWVAVGWIAHAGGDEGGVAAEPCAAVAADRWLVPDGSTETEENEDFVLVMNPFARSTVFSVTLLSERSEPILHSDLADVELGPYRSLAIALNEFVKGERTVSALVDVSVGRVVAGTLGVTAGGGIRSAIGYPGRPPQRLTFPGGGDAGRTDLVVMNAGADRARLSATLLEQEAEQTFAGVAESVPPPRSGRTFPATTTGAASVVFAAEGSEVAAARRTFGVASDQGSTGGASPAATWLILPAAAGSPSHPALVIANPGEEAAEVTLTYLGTPTREVTVTVPPQRTIPLPKGFVQAAPQRAVLASADVGTIVPVSASYSFGRDGFAAYAVALGISVPTEWVPA